MEIADIKNRFAIIGDDPRLNNAINTAVQIAKTDLSVLITGESGVGKEVIPKIIHAYSLRKHNTYIAINCGAIPEGTIESELFGHEKGAFTGANEARKGYFEVADGGTIFLDEVGELPVPTQVRLLRVLESGEFIRVGSSKIQKTNVRVIAASNLDFKDAISVGKFREDLYYRLNAVPIYIPPLRERGRDISLLFKKFALDFSDKYKMPAIQLTADAKALLEAYRWPGNVRQLKNVAEQISVLEEDRQISVDTLKRYISVETSNHLPARLCDSGSDNAGFTEKDIIMKILFQLREDVDDLKTKFSKIDTIEASDVASEMPTASPVHALSSKMTDISDFQIVDSAVEDVPRTIQDVNADLIRKTLEKYDGKRKAAAAELGISERTLYRKIKELKIT